MRFVCQSAGKTLEFLLVPGRKSMSSAKHMLQISFPPVEISVMVVKVFFFFLHSVLQAA